jgi:hypothetical protein
MTRFFLRFIALALALVMIVEAFEPRRSSSTTERALFGYSSAEDCLFGASSVLTSNMKCTDGDEIEHGNAKPEGQSDEETPRPAFAQKPPENV